MLDSLRDTHAALNGSTPVPLDKRGILDEIINSTSPYQILGFAVASLPKSYDDEVRVFYI